MKDANEEYEGVFGGMGYETGDIAIFYPVIVRRDERGKEKRVRCEEKRKLFKKSQYLNISFENVVIGGELVRNKGEIRKEEVMQKFFSSEKEKSEALEEENKDIVDEWDQFAENEKRFHVKASFEEEKYTTELDMNTLSTQQIRRAEQLEKEIKQLPSGGNYHLREDRDQFRNVEELNEDEAYSKVLTAKIEANTDAAAKRKQEIQRAKEELKLGLPLSGHARSHHKNSLDGIGVDSAITIDPETFREMVRYKREQKTMQSVKHMKSLVRKCIVNGI